MARAAPVLAADLPPPHLRNCVKCGFAQVQGTRLVYDWKLAEHFWLVHSGTTEDFARLYHIPSSVLSLAVPRFNRQAKQVVHQNRVRGYTEQILSVVEQVAEEDATRLGGRLSKALDDMESVACMSLAYARGQMMKTVDGRIVVNPYLKPSEVKQLVQIAQAASTTLSNVLTIEREAAGLKSRPKRTVVVTNKQLPPVPSGPIPSNVTPHPNGSGSTAPA